MLIGNIPFLLSLRGKEGKLLFFRLERFFNSWLPFHPFLFLFANFARNNFLTGRNIRLAGEVNRLIGLHGQDAQLQLLYVFGQTPQAI